MINRILPAVFSLCLFACSYRTINNDHHFGDESPVAGAAGAAGATGEEPVEAAGSGGEADAGSEDSSGEMGEPSLTVSFNGPMEQSVDMAVEDATLFCVSLTATGDDFRVQLPLMTIEAIDGGRSVTNSLFRTVFEAPWLQEGTAIVYGRGKVSVEHAGARLILNTFQWGDPLELKEGETRTFCVHSAIVDWSATPEDFFGKKFRVTMDAWAFGDVQRVATGDALPLDRIRTSGGLAGHPVIITSPDGPRSDRFQGNVYAEPDQTLLPARTVLPGDTDVVLASFVLRADGSGGCLRRISLTRAGTGRGETLEYVRLVDSETNEVVYPTRVTADDRVHFGWSDYGLLICLNHGEVRRYVVLVDIAENATPGEQHALGMGDADDLDRVRGPVPVVTPFVGPSVMVAAP